MEDDGQLKLVLGNQTIAVQGPRLAIEKRNDGGYEISLATGTA